MACCCEEVLNGSQGAKGVGCVGTAEGRAEGWEGAPRLWVIHGSWLVAGDEMEGVVAVNGLGKVALYTVDGAAKGIG